MAGLFDYEFDRSVFEAHDGLVTMNNMTVLAQHTEFRGGELDFFIVVGEQYRYVVNLRSETGIDIIVFHSDGSVPLSIIRPRNQSELLEVIDTIAGDHEPVLDAAEAVNA